MSENKLAAIVFVMLVSVFVGAVIALRFGNGGAGDGVLMVPTPNGTVWAPQ